MNTVLEVLDQVEVPNDITLSQEELFNEVTENINNLFPSKVISDNSKITNTEVKTVMDAFVQLQLKKLKLV